MICNASERDSRGSLNSMPKEMILVSEGSNPPMALNKVFYCMEQLCNTSNVDIAHGA